MVTRICRNPSGLALALSTDYIARVARVSTIDCDRGGAYVNLVTPADYIASGVNSDSGGANVNFTRGDNSFRRKVVFVVRQTSLNCEQGHQKAFNIDSAAAANSDANSDAFAAVDC